MKLIKKIAAIMFAFMMVFSLSTNVNAETGVQGQIKVQLQSVMRLMVKSTKFIKF